MAVYRYDDKISKIGNKVYISDSARIIGEITIGDNCYIGHGAVVGFDVVVGSWSILAERHKDFWTYGKKLYVDLAADYPDKFVRLD
jgi:NDP-sugar pyrophosphorylase family protein